MRISLPQPQVITSSFFALATFCLLVGILRVAAEVLIPISLAILLSFLLGPIVTLVERAGINRVFSVVVVTCLSFAMVFLAGWLIIHQLSDLGTNVPQYRANLKQKVISLRGSTDGILSRLRTTTNEIEQDLTSPSLDTAPLVTLPGSTSTQPLWTKPVDEQLTPVALLRNAVYPLVAPLATLGIVIVLSIFMQIHREDLRDRFISLIGGRQINVTTEALDEAGSKVSKYLFMQLVINLSYGLPVGVALHYLGIPNAALWGIVAVVLRFVPYVGPWIAALPPIALSFAISTSWFLPLYTIGIFLILELISSNVLEPFLYGKSTGVSPVAILVAAIFWTWIWGGVGLLLATPLTVCIAVIGKYIPSLHFLSVLLGDTPSLEPEVRVYQRLLAADQEEASEIIHDSLKVNSLPFVFDEILLPALRLSEEDRHQGVIDEAKSEAVRLGFRELIEEAREMDGKRKVSVDTNEVSEALPTSPPLTRAVNVICLPARDEADELAALMLSHLLGMINVSARVLPGKSLTGEMIEEVSKVESPILIISSLPPSASTHTRYILKRLEPKFSSLKLMVGLWDKSGNKETIKQRISSDRSYTLGLSLSEVVDQVRQELPLPLLHASSPTKV